jgi:threonine/homoserine/homoserine lactone efflux protein
MNQFSALLIVASVSLVVIVTVTLAYLAIDRMPFPLAVALLVLLGIVYLVYSGRSPRR